MSPFTYQQTTKRCFGFVFVEVLAKNKNPYCTLQLFWTIKDNNLYLLESTLELFRNFNIFLEGKRCICIPFVYAIVIT